MCKSDIIEAWKRKRRNARNAEQQQSKGRWDSRAAGREYPEEIRKQAIKMYYSGVSANQVGKMFHMNKGNVINWIKKTGDGVDKSGN